MKIARKKGTGVTEWFDGYENDEDNILWPLMSPDLNTPEHLTDVTGFGLMYELLTYIIPCFIHYYTLL